jgi:hypothetical protein
MSGIADYSSTPASNTSINSIGIAGTQSPANFDNALRQLMADLATARTDGALASMPYATKSAGYTLLTTDRGKLIDCTAALEIELLAAATAGAGFFFLVKANGGAVTLDPNGVEEINGSATSLVVADGTSAIVACNGTAWFAIIILSSTSSATTTTAGAVELATDAEAIAKTDTARVITPSNLAALGSSATFAGLVELATDGETQTGTDTARAVTPANLTAKEASSANYLANTADRLLTTDIVWTSAAEVTLTDAATIAVDMSTFINAVVTLGGNRTLGNPTNEKVGQTGYIRIVQDGTGSRTLAYGTDWEFAGGSAPVLTTTAAAQDLLFYTVLASNRIFGSLVKAIA